MNRSPMTETELAEIRAEVAIVEAVVAEHGDDTVFTTFSPRQLVETLLRLLATIEQAQADGASSHSRYLAADSDYRHQSAKAHELFQRMADATRERDELALCLLAERGAGGAPDGWEFVEGRGRLRPHYRRGPVTVYQTETGEGWSARLWADNEEVYRQLDAVELGEASEASGCARVLMLAADRWAAEHPELMTVQPRPHNGAVDDGRWG